MPIKIPDSLPARAVLESENIFVMTEYRAMHQDIRPLNLLILNLMPTKIVTETQLLRKLSNTPLQIHVELLQTASYVGHNTDSSHLDSFYTTFDQVKNQKFDGLIITGAPVENLEFDQVDYWEELCQIMEWSKTNVHSTLHICWAAHAALYHYYGIINTACVQSSLVYTRIRFCSPITSWYVALMMYSMPPTAGILRSRWKKCWRTPAWKCWRYLMPPGSILPPPETAAVCS